MKKLNLKKSKIAIIRNVNFLKGGTDSTNDIGPKSATCQLNCEPIVTTNPGTTRPNGSVKTKLGVECLI